MTVVTVLGRALETLKVVLINTYELGRQPFALAEPAAWLRADGFNVHCLDLSVQRLEDHVLENAGLVAIYLGMHTATRLAVEALPRIKHAAPTAHLCAFGLYAPMNQRALLRLGVRSLLGGESEPRLLSLANLLRSGEPIDSQGMPRVDLDKITFRVPDRSLLPPLSSYAHLRMPDGEQKTTGFVETSRGCKHVCRHCPVVPVYNGRFRIIPVDIVLKDVGQQVVSGATHISFGDPDFLNGPTHARRVIEAMQRQYPRLTFDATIKIEHIIKHSALLPKLAEAGCLFVTTAVESVDDCILAYLKKGHTTADFAVAVGLLRDSGIAISPTFVPFTPWTTVQGYLTLLRRIVELELVESVSSVQLGIRLLIPDGSHMLRLPAIEPFLKHFDPNMLGYPWRYEDPKVDRLQRSVQELTASAGAEGQTRRQIFQEIWGKSHELAGISAPALPIDVCDAQIPHMSEPWYCCAEPTAAQLRSF